MTPKEFQEKVLELINRFSGAIRQQVRYQQVHAREFQITWTEPGGFVRIATVWLSGGIARYSIS